jgi:hypothetical protein
MRAAGLFTGQYPFKDLLFGFKRHLNFSIPEFLRIAYSFQIIVDKLSRLLEMSTGLICLLHHCLSLILLIMRKLLHKVLDRLASDIRPFFIAGRVAGFLKHESEV